MAAPPSPLRIYLQNIACSSRDEATEGMALDDRLHMLIVNIVEAAPDVVLLFEAGRASKGKSWTTLAADIEKCTDLTYIGLMHANATKSPFAHALFVNRRTAFVAAWRNHCAYKSDAGIDSHVTTVMVRSVGNDDHYLVIGGVHMPVSPTPRAAVTEWLTRNHDLATFWAGDFNTFPDGNGPWMIEKLEATGMFHAPCNLDYTFRGFDYDTITVEKERRHLLHPMAEILSETDTHITARPVSVLDHVFINRNITASMKATFMPPTPASDHCAILVDASWAK